MSEPLSFMSFLSLSSCHKGFASDIAAGEFVFYVRDPAGFRHKRHPGSGKCLKEIPWHDLKKTYKTYKTSDSVFSCFAPQGQSAHKDRRLKNPPSCRQTTPDVDMDNSRELASLLRRANRLSILQVPPKLELAVVNDGDELPPPSPWRLILQIQPKLRSAH